MHVLTGMRRPLLLALLGVMVLPAFAVTGVASAQDPPPTRPALQLTDADDGRTVHVAPGVRVLVRLAAPGSGDVWRGLEDGGPTLHVVRYSTSGSGLEVDLDALDARPEPQGLTAYADAACFHAEPACARPGRVWRASIVVDAGPTDPSDLACTTYARPSASAAPGTVYAAAEDDGRTVRVPRDGRLVLFLDGCAEPSWALPSADRALVRTSADLDRQRGAVSAVFVPQASGTATVTAGADARCLHRTTPCSVAARAFTLTVEVTPASSPSPHPCAKPVFEGVTLSPLRVAAGDPVSVQGGRRDLCVEESQEPEREFTLLARSEGGPESVVEQRRARFFRSEVRPGATTTYRLLMDGSEVGSRPQDTTVVVDRVSGSCANLRLGGPARTAAGSPAVLTGSTPDSGTVRVFFRRHNQPYSLRRTLTPGPDGRFTTSFSVTADHRWYASTDRCDTVPGLTQAVPVVLGPARVRRGDTVTLRVLAPTDVRTVLFFRGAGQTFTPRRAFRGPGTTTYVATSDQRYYPATPSTTGAPRLTQVLR